MRQHLNKSKIHRQTDRQTDKSLTVSSVQNRTDWDRSGKVRTGQDRSRLVRTGQDRSGQVRTGQDRSVQVRTVQEMCYLS